jgi:hypothetical protein
MKIATVLLALFSLTELLLTGREGPSFVACLALWGVPGDTKRAARGWRWIGARRWVADRRSGGRSRRGLTRLGGGSDG